MLSAFANTVLRQDDVVVLGAHRFFRIHRSRIVNLERVRELRIAGGSDHQVVLRNGERLGLSRL